MKYNPSNLKWGIAGPSDKLVASFDDQATATTFHKTISNQGRFSGQQLQVVNLETGEPISQRELEGAGDSVR